MHKLTMHGKSITLKIALKMGKFLTTNIKLSKNRKM